MSAYWLSRTFLLLAGLVIACQTPTAKKQKLSELPVTALDSRASPSSQHPAAPDMSNALVADTSLPEVADTTNQDMAKYFLVIVDTGSNYNSLRNQMLGLAYNVKVPIDTLGRTFDKVKNRITLPEDDEDEMYAGDYFPRRIPSRSLSLEYFDVYQKNADPQTIAMVAGIYEQAASADSALALLKQAAPKAFRLDANFYIGCMH